MRLWLLVPQLGGDSNSVLLLAVLAAKVVAVALADVETCAACRFEDDAVLLLVDIGRSAHGAARSRTSCQTYFLVRFWEVVAAAGLVVVKGSKQRPRKISNLSHGS